MRIFLHAGLAIAAACGSASMVKARSADTITLDLTPCFGVCPSYRVTVDRDGNGVFIGQHFTAVAGERRFKIDRATFDRFARHLRSIKPRSGNVSATETEPLCMGETNVVVTDGQTATITWRSNAPAAVQTLKLNFSCQGSAAKRWVAIVRAAPDLLPIAAFIGSR